MRSGSTPDWARRLVLGVCEEARVSPPDVFRWRRADREISTGLTRRKARSIAVSAGRDLHDARHTLLHELAHWLAPDEERTRRRRRRFTVHHGREFYTHALPLFARHEPPMVDALRREASRYPSCLRFAAAAGMAGASELIRERRVSAPAARARWRILVPEHPVELARRGRWYVCVTCGRRLVGRNLLRSMRMRTRQRHTLWTRQPEAEATA
jgi:hypothetical protein